MGSGGVGNGSGFGFGSGIGSVTGYGSGSGFGDGSGIVGSGVIGSVGPVGLSGGSLCKSYLLFITFTVFVFILSKSVTSRLFLTSIYYMSQNRFLRCSLIVKI